MKTKMKKKITLTLEQLQSLIGKAKAAEVMTERPHVHMRRKEVRRIELALTEHGICAVRVAALDASR